MSSSKKQKCKKCGKEFDSKKELHIHQTQVHEPKSSNLNIKSIRPWIFCILVVSLGLLFLTYFGEEASEQGNMNKRTENIKKTPEMHEKDVITRQVELVVKATNNSSNSLKNSQPS